MAIYFLIKPLSFLISVIRAYILVFDASVSAESFLSLPLRFLNSVIPAVILVPQVSLLTSCTWKS
ncbi:hypothetical protein [Microseira wollei]|nr:hypothetical protein [Microseira wollei]